MSISSSNKNTQNAIFQFKYREKIEDFSSNLQKGDLGLCERVEFGLVLYGQSKTGKTATGHLLVGNPLKGQKKDGQQVLQITTTKNKRAKIGNQGNSQTEIPNFFEVKFKSQKYHDKKMYVIDTPGYGDTKGVLKILTNGYYHYRLYSKVENMKFILCIDRKDLSNTAQRFIDTIRQFTSSFKNYLVVKQKIWISCAFLITKVEVNENDNHQTTVKDLEDKFNNIINKLNTQLMQDQQKALKDFVGYVIRQKKIFYIKKFKRGQSAVCNGLLEKIDSQIDTWWTRKYDEKTKQVDMSPIQFGLAKEVILCTTKQDKSKLQFIELVEYYNMRIRQFVQTKVNLEDVKKVGSLSYVIMELVKDAMGAPSSHQFLDLMHNYNELYYHKYDQQYLQQRQKRQKQLFSLPQEQLIETKKNSVKAKRIGDKNYVVKKFEALKQIQVFKEEINSLETSERFQWLQSCEQKVYSIIKELNKVCYKRSKSSQIIYKYGYLIHRIIQQSKVFTLLMDVYAPKDIRQKIMELTNRKFIDLNRPLKDFMGVSYTYNNQSQIKSKDLQYMFVKEFDQTKVSKNYPINEPLIEFFSKTNVNDEDVIRKIVKLILKYSDRILDEIENEKQEINLDERQRLIKRLTVSRVNCQNLYYQLQGDEKIQIAMIIRNITNNLGKLLEYSNKYQLARKVYNTIRFVESCCKMYELEIQGNSKDIKLRIDYSKYLADHFREDEAIRLLQKTYEIAKTTDQLKMVKQQISDLRIKIRECPINDYQQSLFNQEYFADFNQLYTELMA